MSTKSEPEHCPKCGREIPADAPQGICPKCLIWQASVSTEAAKGEPPPSTPPRLEDLSAAFPHLEILELIGQGGMGFVFKARQLNLDRLVALKILSQALAADPAFAERFNREGRLLARLNHPNIVTVHDYGHARGFFFLLMEFVDGVNLRQAMQASRLSPAQALAIVPKICEALEFAHGEGILHRDIKPENILMDVKSRVKIADFGIAKLLDEPTTGAALTGSRAALGTPHYMAPEQIENPRDVDQRADIYSLGVVFYEMLTGELPLGRFAPPSAKSTVDPRVDDVVFGTLERERENRFRTAGEVKTSLETIAANKSSGEKLEGRLAEQTGTQQLRIVLALLVALGCVAGGVALFWPFGTPIVSSSHSLNPLDAPELVLDFVDAHISKFPTEWGEFEKDDVEKVNWHFQCLIPPKCLVQFLVIETIENKDHERSQSPFEDFSAYYEVGNAPVDVNVEVQFTQNYTIPSDVATDFLMGKWVPKAANRRSVMFKGGFSSGGTEINGEAYTVQKNIRKLMISRSMQDPKKVISIGGSFYREHLKSGHQLSVPLADMTDASNETCRCELRIFLEPFNGPLIRTRPPEMAITNGVCGPGFFGTEEEAKAKMKQFLVSP